MDKLFIKIFCTISGTGKVGKVLAERGAKNVSLITHGTKEQLTVMFTGNARGDMLPPMLLLPDRNPAKQNKRPEYGVVNETAIDDSRFWVNEKGWMTAATFVQYLVYFDEWIADREEEMGIRRPILLVIDGLGSHSSTAAAEFAISKQIILWLTPANATQVKKKKHFLFFFFMTRSGY